MPHVNLLAALNVTTEAILQVLCEHNDQPEDI